MRARTQVTVAATAVAAVLVALSGQFLVWRVDHRDRADLDRVLAARAAQIRTEAATSGKLPADGVYAVRLMSGTQVRAQSGSTVQFGAPVRDGYSTVAAADGGDYRSWAETLKSGVQMQVLTSLSDVQGRHDQAIRLVDLSVLVAILIGALATWFTSGIVLRPLRRLQDGAQELSPGDLSGRLPSPAEPREVADLAASVNALLDRMQAVAESPAAATPAPDHEADLDVGVLREALAKLGGDLDTLLDNPELSTTQRHLVLASIQNEYRRIVLLTGSADPA